MRKGLEISITFAVILIITILVFGLSIAFLGKIFKGTKDIADRLDKQTENEVERLILEEGALVAIPFSTAEMKTGQKKLFGVGIRNVGDSIQEFQVTAKFDSALINNALVSDADSKIQKSWAGGLARQLVSVEPNKSETSSVFLQVPSGTKKGIYYWNVCVTKETALNEYFECEMDGGSIPDVYSDKMYQIEVKVS